MHKKHPLCKNQAHFPKQKQGIQKKLPALEFFLDALEFLREVFP